VQAFHRPHSRLCWRSRPAAEKVLRVSYGSISTTRRHALQQPRRRATSDPIVAPVAVAYKDTLCINVRRTRPMSIAPLTVRSSRFLAIVASAWSTVLMIAAVIAVAFLPTSAIAQDQFIRSIHPKERNLIIPYVHRIDCTQNEEQGCERQCSAGYNGWQPTRVINMGCYNNCIAGCRNIVMSPRPDPTPDDPAPEPYTTGPECVGQNC
jgi:hypothetical protein